jgi:hypothetical protein
MSSQGNKPAGGKTWKDWKHLITSPFFNEISLSAEDSASFMRFVESCPEFVKTYETTLHWVASQDPPVELIRAVIRADPDALTGKKRLYIQDRYQKVTPLGLACRSGAPFHVIRTLLRETVLLKARTKSRKRDRNDWWLSEDNEVCPFATTGIEKSSFSVETMRVMLEEFPDGVWSQEDPLERRCLIGEVMKNIRCDSSFWEKFNLILMAASFGTIKESEMNGRTFFVLHAFLDMIGCVGPIKRRRHNYDSRSILKILKIIKMKVPEQFCLRDQHGRLPLHIVVSAHGLGGASELVKFLLTVHPESVRIPDGKGRLPLHVAVENQLFSCIDLLVHAEPRALVTRCVVTHLHPFQLTAYRAHVRKNKRLE